MDEPFNPVDRNELKPGDHIYTWRAAFTYAHHGVYVGGDKVIHFTSDQENTKSNSGWKLSSSLPVPSLCSNNSSRFNSSCLNSSCLNSSRLNSSRSKSSYVNSSDSGYSLHNGDPRSCLCTYYCGFHHRESGVTLSCLNCFIRTGSLYLYQYGVDKFVHLTTLRGGICTIAPSDPPQDVIDRAVYLLGQRKGFGDYNVARNNCEDFALYCKTELLIDGKSATGGSGQVNSIVNIPWKSALQSMIQKLVFKTYLNPLTVPVIVERYRWDRYKTDIGVRDDAVKVKVKDVESFMLSRGY